MEEQQDKDCYHYTSQIIHMKGYIKQIMWKLLQDKPKSESIIRDLKEAKTERSQQSRENWRKTYDVLQKTIRWKRGLC
jgi:hypothetical protein